MKHIPLNKGLFAIVDDEDYDYLSQWKWYVAESCGIRYAIRKYYCEPGLRTTMNMHREILKCPIGMYVDHIDHDGLHNYKSNLRICTASQNQMNRRKLKIKNSIYKGVSLRTVPYGYILKSGIRKTHNHRHVFVSSIKVNGKTINLGEYESEIDAAIIYDQAAKKYYGEFAHLNFE